MILSSLAPARRRLVLILAAVVSAAVIALVAFVVVDRVNGSGVDAAPQDQPGPVLLVPGYGGSTSALDTLAATLRTDGRTAQVVDLPGGGTGDLKVQARAVAAAATSLLARTGSRSVDVVGYSAGGVVARLWIRDFGGASKVRRIVTLGSPQHGTEVAALAGSLIGCPVACQQLEPDSAVLNSLNAGDETPAGPEWVSVWSAVDQVVVPPDSAGLAGALDMTVQSICASSTVAHGNLPTDPLVMNIVRAELSGASTALLTSADCARLSG